jgi:hypothetical protein
MSIRARAGITGLAVATCTAVGLVGPTAVASAATPAKAQTVTVTMSNSAIAIGKNNQIAAGTTAFKIVSTKGQHDLQIAQLHKGYSLQQLGHDINLAFSKGNIKAINNLDNNVTFFGGAGASPGHPGLYTQTLRAGTYYAVDTDGNAVAKLTVKGAGHVARVPHNSTVTAFTYGFTNTPRVLPHQGTMFFDNHADQPHFLVMQAVKQSTTNRDVEKFIKSGGNGNPSWGLPFSTGTGVISPTIGMNWQYNVPAGKYLLACFWPDDRTGMPHFFMGMWELVQVH